MLRKDMAMVCQIQPGAAKILALGDRASTDFPAPDTSDDKV